MMKFGEALECLKKNDSLMAKHQDWTSHAMRILSGSLRTVSKNDDANVKFPDFGKAALDDKWVVGSYAELFGGKAE